MKDLFSIQDKVAIVTGGSRGIGAMIARGFVEHGARVYITARSEALCRETADELSLYGQCVALPADLSTLVGINAFVEAFAAREEHLDILVNNAGAMKGAPLQDYPEADWDWELAINLKSPFFLVQQLLGLLKQRASPEDPARVINIASNAGILPPHRHKDFAYTASKGGLINLTRHLAMNLCQDAIAVNAISPGLFPSEITRGMIADYGEQFARSVPLGRIGKPEDIAAAAIYLASPGAAWLTGVNLPVDGGNVVKR